MTYKDGIDYNVEINTPRFTMVPMCVEDNYDDLLALCRTRGFSYPYIHYNERKKHRPLKQRVKDYAEMGNTAITGEYGRTLINVIEAKNPDDFNGKRFLGAAILISIEENNPMFKESNPEKDIELGIFTHIAEWGKGIGTEATYFMMQHALEHWKTEKFWASIEPSRLGSIKVMDKLGLTPCDYILADKMNTPLKNRKIPYNNAHGGPSSRLIMSTPDKWTLSPWEMINNKKDIVGNPQPVYKGPELRI